MNSDMRNAEGYVDTVPFEVMRNIVREERKAARPAFRPLVYICSPFSDNPGANTEKAKRYCRFAVDAGAIPFASHLFLPQFMSEETERETAMFFNKVFLGRCEQLWVFGDRISEGMAREIRWAERRFKEIRYFTEECEERNKED